MAKHESSEISIGTHVRYTGASAGTQQRSHGRVGTVLRLATWEGRICMYPATARVAWSDGPDDWNHVLVSELAAEPAT